MEIGPRKLIYYETEIGYAPFQEWYLSLRNLDAQIAVQSRLTRLQRGLFGDCKPVGEGVYELRVFVGPGYRIYVGLKEKAWVILLCGGDKNRQDRDIQAAKNYWQDYQRRSVK
ncbi:MAG: type II toxin-antitoxin system RelE/ParE family toxin [Elusimicrobiota bacterium]